MKRFQHLTHHPQKKRRTNQGKFISVLAIFLIATNAPSVNALDQRSFWDHNKLPSITDPNDYRAIFGFFPNRSVNDDYSFTVTQQSPTRFQYFRVVLSPCSSIVRSDKNYDACIENVSFRKIGAKNWTQASLAKVQLGEPTTTIKKGGDLVVGKPISSDPQLLRPPGDRATIWNLSSAPHSKGPNYLVRAAIAHPGADNISYVDGGLQRLFSFEIVPISFTSSGGVITQDQFSVEEFPEGYEYRLRLHLGVYVKAISGWFFGRVQNPTIERNGPEGFLDVSGSPARVPVGVTDVIPTSNVPKKYSDKCIGLEYCYWTAKTFSKGTFFTALDGIDPEILADFESVPGGVKTAATLSSWEMDTSRLSQVTGPDSSYRECVENLYGKGARVLLGAVNSNATLYQQTPPTWDNENKTFTFKVASPHLDATGKPNKGFYTLHIPVEQAKCRWGEDASLPQAQVQVINQDGSSSITTAVATTQNGMLKFNIAGFGYSAPSIRIKMSKKAFSMTIPDIAKSTTITCVKGKVTKKIKAVAPKCPAGYKKK
jgi:hypothetical protein